MISNPTRRSYAVYLAPLMFWCTVFWCTTGGARAQDTSEMREILTRLDRLEKDNQALTAEIQALRQELAAATRPPNTVVPNATPPPEGSPGATTAGQPAPASAPTAEETAAVQGNRIDELAQTKVEASQKFPLTVTGMLLFNGFVNGRFNSQMGDPLVASLTPGA